MNDTIARVRFFAQISPEPNTGCWLWLGTFKDDRYGCFRGERAHRAAWELFNAAVPAGLFVLHRCDQPACVNPAHLFLGTHAENMADMTSKGRSGRCAGERHGQARLNDERVRLIRANAAELSQRELAKRHGVSQRAVLKILNRETWRHVDA